MALPVSVINSLRIGIFSDRDGVVKGWSRPLCNRTVAVTNIKELNTFGIYLNQSYTLTFGIIRNIYLNRDIYLSIDTLIVLLENGVNPAHYMSEYNRPGVIWELITDVGFAGLMTNMNPRLPDLLRTLHKLGIDINEARCSKPYEGVLAYLILNLMYPLATLYYELGYNIDLDDLQFDFYHATEYYSEYDNEIPIGLGVQFLSGIDERKDDPGFDKCPLVVELDDGDLELFTRYDLIYSSVYFKNLLEGEWKENGAESTVQTGHAWSNIQAFNIIVDFCKWNWIGDEVDLDICVSLLGAAEYYQLDYGDMFTWQLLHKIAAHDRMDIVRDVLDDEI